MICQCSMALMLAFESATRVLSWLTFNLRPKAFRSAKTPVWRNQNFPVAPSVIRRIKLSRHSDN